MKKEAKIGIIAISLLLIAGLYFYIIIPVLSSPKTNFKLESENNQEEFIGKLFLEIREDFDEGDLIDSSNNYYLILDGNERIELDLLTELIPKDFHPGMEVAITGKKTDNKIDLRGFRILEPIYNEEVTEEISNSCDEVINTINTYLDDMSSQIDINLLKSHVEKCKMNRNFANDIFKNEINYNKIINFKELSDGSGHLQCYANDINNDFIIGMFDLLIVLSNWGDSGEGDVNGDGLIDFTDLLLIIGDWGPVSHCLSVGPYHLGVGIIRFEESTHEPWPHDWIRDDIFDEDSTWSMTNIIREFSYDKTWLVEEAFVNISVPGEERCLTSEERIEIGDQYFNYSNFPTVVFIYDLWDTSCQTLVTFLEFPTEEGDYFLNNIVLNSMNSYNFLHEIGHSFGILAHHASYLDCQNETITNFSVCSIDPVGDRFDTLGLAIESPHYNGFHKEQFGWFSDEEFIEIEDWGVYDIGVYELQESKSKVFSIYSPIEDLRYSLEYRRPLGQDELSDPRYGEDWYNGSLIHFDDEAATGETVVLDFTPYVDSDIPPELDKFDVALRPGSIFYSRFFDVVISVLSINETSLRFEYGLPYCLDGDIDYGEYCDSDELGGASCINLGYDGGILSCTDQCTFDISECGPEFCEEGDIYLGNGDCKKIIYGLPDDNYVSNSGEDWNEARFGDEGNYLANKGDFILNSLLRNRIGLDPVISRISLVFDTSIINDAIDIKNASLEIMARGRSSSEEHDFLIIVPTTIPDPLNLGLEDFNDFSFIDNPIELSDRLDISDNLEEANMQTVYLNLNENGKNYINLDGYTNIGIRGGMDLISDPDFETINVDMISSDNPGIDNHPKLIIIY